jgi:2-polyprenyl-3-methyl-5-hydroxy-6-metoxy-1,4-benzoquinol methylase
MQPSWCAACAASLSRRAMVRLGRARLERCDTCGSWTYLPRPTAHQQAAIHDNEEYYAHPYFQGRRKHEQALRRRCRQVFRLIGEVIPEEDLRGERLLDVGCDTGAFLLAARQLYGIVPVGVDVAQRAVAIARKQGVEAYDRDLGSAPTQLRGFRVITAIDLIEHVSDPRQFLQQIHDRLRPGGVAYLETPNISSLVYRTGCVLCKLTNGHPRRTFERLFPPQHVQYFTENGFASMARRSALELVHLGKRPLAFADLATSLGVAVGIGGLQMLDRLMGTQILLCALLRRPE